MRLPRPSSNWFVYWVGVMFIVLCVTFGLARCASAQEPCEEERARAAYVCKKKGKRSRACAEAKDELALCRAVEGGDDPIGGI